MYIAQINDLKVEIERTSDGFSANGKLVSWDLSTIEEGYFHILMNGRSYRAEIVSKEGGGKKWVIKVNGKNYPVALKDRFDVLLEKMGMSTSAGAKLNHIKAPMPGLIIALKVKDGDEVKAGDTLLILEAMKMENIIKAPADAVVKNVKVRMGQGVEKNQVLIEF